MFALLKLLIQDLVLALLKVLIQDLVLALLELFSTLAHGFFLITSELNSVFEHPGDDRMRGKGAAHVSMLLVYIIIVEQLS